ncbi:hypothetical protein DICVIV_13840 [Dictyocaulus viviparus]|uniref:Uncharacterized protein n=1 Tax=Dictyocaulus viviparus TaxID=29172 RepID=A0A0D8XCS3_DICVI|nr:hypothetical protein DICVIV_13840 [Dictyocaulus viviparus]
MNNQTVNDYPSHPPVLPISYKKLLNWSCNVFPGDDHTCVSTITTEKCRNGTQFSARYWGSAGSREKKGQFVSCVNMSVFFSLVLNDHEEETGLVEIFGFRSGPSSLLRHNISLRYLHPSPVIHYNSTSCVIPHRATLSFTHINGFINGAYLSSSYDYRTISDVENRIRISFRSQFIQYFELCQKSRFELQRSRFYCPSDVTCLQELWFPLDDLPTSTISVIGCITVVILVTVLTIKQNHLTYFNCDCRSVLSKAKL